MNGKEWTDKERRIVRQFYVDIPTKEICEYLGRPLSSVYQQAAKMGLHKSIECIAEEARQRSSEPDHGGRRTRFQKGIVPHNKGVKRPGWAAGRMREAQFKKGQKPHTWKPLYSTRFSKEGYLQMKMSDTGYPPHDWVGVHILIWEDKHGPVPAGCAVVFKDGDKARIRLRNLELISRAELMRRNSIHNRYPKEMVNTIMLLGAVKRKLRERRGKEHDDGPAQPSV